MPSPKVNYVFLHGTGVKYIYIYTINMPVHYIVFFVYVGSIN